MGLFKCRLCGKVYPTTFLSIKNNLCRDCFMKLEDLYSRSRIHDYIRDHGLDEDFDINELAKELRMNPKSVEVLYNLGFFDRDMQVYSSTTHRKTLAQEFKHELDRIKSPIPSEKSQSPVLPPPPRKLTSYGGRIYDRRFRRY